MLYIMPDFKGDDETLDYVFDFTDRLVTGETIVSAIVTVDTGITLDDYSFDDNTVTAWLSGGSPDTWYDCNCVVTTSDGRVKESTFRVRVVAKK